MKHKVIAMRLIKPRGEMTDYFGEKIHVNIGIPDGAIGIVFVFESKKKAIKYFGRGTELLRIKEKVSE